MATDIRFCKMHGLGNDFVVIDAISQNFAANSFPIQRFADRHQGIGFDQLLVIEKSSTADFACRIFNADGGEAEQCGNGLRCITRYIYDNGLSTSKTFSIATKAGRYEARIEDNHLITVSMGAPIFQPEMVPFITNTPQQNYPLSINDVAQNMQMFVLSMGNPHAIIQVKDLLDFPVSEVGGQVASMAVFPQSTNVGFMEIIDRQRIHLRTFERGTGETNACGSNACAAVVAGIVNNTLDHAVDVKLALGSLKIAWDGNNAGPVFMTGPAIKVFDGLLSLE
jgi:diaminopimelate epimerase